MSGLDVRKLGNANREFGLPGNTLPATKGLAHRRRKRAAGFVTLASGSLVRRRPRIETSRLAVHMPRLPKRLEGLRIAFAADFHLSYIHPTFRVREAVNAIAALEADLVLLGGDYLTKPSHSFEAVIAQLATLDAPHGVFAVAGNHDYASGVFDLGEAVAHTHIQDLTNRGFAITSAPGHSDSIDTDGALWIAGLDDLWHGTPDVEAAMAGAPDGAPRILVSHNPYVADILPAGSADLILAGHTHGWQVYIPGVSRAFVPRHKAKYRHGFYHTRAGRMYVTRGVGHSHVPVRLGSRPEVVLLTLVS